MGKVERDEIEGDDAGWKDRDSLYIILWTRTRIVNPILNELGRQLT